MRKNSQQRLWLVCRKSGAVTEHLIRHNAGEDQSERKRENDQCGRREPRSGNAQVHHTEIVNCAVEIQAGHHNHRRYIWNWKRDCGENSGKFCVRRYFICKLWT